MKYPSDLYHSNWTSHTHTWHEVWSVKIDMPNSTTYPKRTHVFEWYVVWCGSKSGYQKDKCFEEIRLHAQNVVDILGSIVNIIGRDLYDHLMSMRI